MLLLWELIAIQALEDLKMIQISNATDRSLSVTEDLEQEKSWVEVNFQKRECIKFIPNCSHSTEVLSRCGCGRWLSDHHFLTSPALLRDEELLPLGATARSVHDKFLVVSELASTLQNETVHVDHYMNRAQSKQDSNKWSVATDTALFPTDAFGTLEFQGTGEGDKSQYVRLSYDTKPDLVLQLLLEHWKLSPPKMVISVHGGAHNFSLQSKLQRVFCNGLVKAAKTTGAWIMTFGLNTGVGKIVGDALKEHKARSRRKIISIGVAPWGVVDHREDLIDSEPISAYQTMNNPLSKGSVLHAAHSHFLLVDHGTEGRYDSELRFRRLLERRLSQQHLNPHRTSMVCLVLEGGKNTINVVLESVRQNPPIPVIVCDGSGRAADLLTFAHQYAEDDGTMLEDLRVQLLALIQQTFKCSRDQAQYFFLSIMECVRKKELITIFRMGNGCEQDDIDIAILTAILKAQCKSAPDMLNLALSWNRKDVATSQIFVYGREWPVLSLEQGMMDALINDRVDFVKLLMENGVSMHKFLTCSRLEELYNAKPPVHLVYLINDVKPNIPPGYRFTLIDIGQVIELLMGEAYRSSYTRKRLRMYYAAKLKIDSNKRKPLTSIMRLNACGSTRTNTKPKEGVFSLHTPNKTCLKNPETVQPPHFPYPFHDLLVWAVLMKRQKMALFMWQNGEEAIAKALVASKLYKRMAREATDDNLDLEESDQFRVYSKEFQDLAIQLLKICYRADDDATQHLLTYELKHWSRHTCLSLAVDAGHRDLIAHPCVQLLLNDLWMGGLSARKNSNLKVILGILFPPALLALNFKTFEELQLMPQTVEEHFLDRSSLSSSVESSSSSSSASSSSSSPSSNPTMISLPKPEVLGRPITGSRERDAFTMLSKQPRQLAFSKKIYEFYSAPITKFWMYAMAYLCVLLLFTYVVLVRMSSWPSIQEWVVISYVTTISIEKVREIVASQPSGATLKLKVWGSHFWNVMDAVTIIMFFTALGLRLAQDTHILQVGRAVYCANIVLWYIHLLDVFSVSKHLGPYVMLMGKMMVDLATFIILVAVVLTSFGVARQAILHPNATADWNLFKNVTLEPYFMLYGEVYAGTIDPCAGEDKELCVVGAWLAPVLMTLYLLIANILLLNLLIAVFNNTFERIKNHSDRIWKFQRYLKIVEYELRPTLPPPLILVSYIVMVFRRICKKRKSGTSDRGLKLFLDDKDVEKLHDFEEDCLDEYFRSKHKEKSKGRNNTEERLNRLLDAMEEFHERDALLTDQMIDLHDRLERLDCANRRLLQFYPDGLDTRLQRNENKLNSSLERVFIENQGFPRGSLPEIGRSRERRWLQRRLSNYRKDSEMAAKDQNQFKLMKTSRTTSYKESTPFSHLQKSENTTSLRRVSSTGAIHKHPSLSGEQSEDRSNRARYKSYDLLSKFDDTRFLSCQDLAVRPKNANRSASTSSEKNEKSAIYLPQPVVSTKPLLKVNDIEIGGDNYELVISPPGPERSSDESKQSKIIVAEADSVSKKTIHEDTRRSCSSLNVQLNDSVKIVTRVRQTRSTSSTPQLTRQQRAGKVGDSRRTTVLNSSGHTPLANKSTYKSITDDIDTTGWHKTNTFVNGCWDRKIPDIEVYHSDAYSNHTSMSEWEEEGDANIKPKRRYKSKTRSKRKKLLQRHVCSETDFQPEQKEWWSQNFLPLTHPK